MNTRIRIKDIAERAGVSVGTVDRVLHNRPNVSESALKKVKKALSEMDYEPNAYASALASNRACRFFLLIPKMESEAYWTEVEEGALHARDVRRDFKVEVVPLYYNRFKAESFRNTCKECIKSQPDGVIVVPGSLEDTKQFTDELTANGVPYVLLDSYMPDLRPLAFFGQDSFASGYFAAKILGLIAGNEEEIMIMKQTQNGRIPSKQQDNREVGFRHYMHDHFPKMKITEVDLPQEDNGNYDRVLEDFFTSHPKLHHCITFTSKAFIVGEFLLKTNRRDVQIMGYDMLKNNAECVRQGSISFLIAQHGYMQGYNCVETLFRAIILKDEITPVHYMPIELLTKENVDYYQRTQV